MAITCVDFMFVNDDRDEAEEIKEGLCHMFAGTKAFVESDLIITPVRRHDEEFIFNVVMFREAFDDEHFLETMQKLSDMTA